VTDIPRVFISYARKDGEAFAKRLRERLEKEQPEITLWRDREEMEGGISWWRQITEALDKVEFLLLVMTPAALKSPITRKEWRYARQQGVCVYPVKAVPDAELDFENMPQWMRKAHFYDLDHEWETFVNYLKSPCHVARVPFMAPDLPEGFVQRPAEFEQLLNYLLQGDRQNPVAITTALHGAGGFGKTTLATALCHNDDVITTFDDGVLWVTLGGKPNVLDGLTQLYAALTGERPGFVDEEDAIVHLVEKLEDKSCLIVIDDVWNRAHLRHFLRGGKDCARLITTRQFEIAAEASRVDVDEMTSSEAVQLLTTRLDPPPRDLTPLRKLAQRLGEWPLMLELAGAALRHRIARGDTLEGALDYVNRALDKRGTVAFDQRNATERHQAIAKTIDVSLEFLTEDERGCFLELAIFPENTDVPLTAVGTLWDLDDFDTEDMVQRLHDCSLLKFDLQHGTIRLHDVMRDFLTEQLVNPPAIHARLVDAWGDPHNLPDAYAWHWIAYHLMKAGGKEELKQLLLDFDWLQAKLEATDVNALIADYDFLPDDKNLRLVQGALRLSAHVLAQDKTQLAEQLLGRLMSFESPEIQTFLDQTRCRKGGPWLRPLTPNLTRPGGPLVQTLQGHTDAVYAVTVFDGGRKAISASSDNTLKVWNLDTGKELQTLQGHTDEVDAVTVFDSGRKAISASFDDTLKVWNLDTGKELQTLQGHADEVDAVTVFDGGRKAISASSDDTLKVWNLKAGKELQTLQGHTKWVTAVAVFDDGRKAVSTSWDNTLEVWNLKTGAELQTLQGHSDFVRTVVVFDDGRKAISVSRDNTLKVWNLETGALIATYVGESGSYDCAVTPDGATIVTGEESGRVNFLRLEGCDIWHVSSPCRYHASGEANCRVTLKW